MGVRRAGVLFDSQLTQNKHATTFPTPPAAPAPRGRLGLLIARGAALTRLYQMKEARHLPNLLFGLPVVDGFRIYS
jgi:hypothetical protein